MLISKVWDERKPFSPKSMQGLWDVIDRPKW